jgi:hypothetical protein
MTRRLRSENKAWDDGSKSREKTPLGVPKIPLSPSVFFSFFLSLSLFYLFSLFLFLMLSPIDGDASISVVFQSSLYYGHS